MKTNERTYVYSDTVVMQCPIEGCDNACMPTQMALRGHLRKHVNSGEITENRAREIARDRFGGNKFGSKK